MTIQGEVMTMQAVVQHRYGPPDTLQVERLPVPSPGPGEVLVRVRAAALNAKDWHIMRGEPRLARLNRAVFGARGPRVPTPGTDLAGVVEAVGEGVTRWAPGDAVFGEGAGAFAEYAVVPAPHLATLPEGLTFEQAAALPLAATTAWLCIEAAAPEPDAGAVHRESSHGGCRILINGASGGVGTFAVQLAKLRQLDVTAVVSPRNAHLAARLGADHLIDYTRQDFTQAGGQYDAVLDLVGNRSLRDLRRVVLPGGVLVLSGGGVPGTGRYLGPLPLLLQAQLSKRRSSVHVVIPRAAPDAALLAMLASMVAGGRIEPVMDRQFPLAKAADAVQYMESTHARGKVLIVTKEIP